MLVKKKVAPKNAFAAQQLHTKIRFRCFVIWEKKSVQKLARKKRKYKEKKRNKPHYGQKWVGWDKRVF